MEKEPSNSELKSIKLTITPEKELESIKLTITPENQMKDHSGNAIKEIKLFVSHGAGYASSASCISFKLISESVEEPKDIGGFTIIDNKLALIKRGQIPENDTTPGGQLAKAVNTFFANHPKEVEKIKEELQKSE